jgi:hypothetical protein
MSHAVHHSNYVNVPLRTVDTQQRYSTCSTYCHGASAGHAHSHVFSQKPEDLFALDRSFALFAELNRTYRHVICDRKAATLLTCEAA